MAHPLDVLLSLLQLEALDEDTFRGPSQDLGWGQVFGGQVMAQSLCAATHTVARGRSAHSFHGYFLRPGNTSEPIRYHVERVRDGSSFTTRRVVANQRDATIFTMTASFHVEEDGLEHQDDAPSVADPESLLSNRDLARRMIDQFPPQMRGVALAPRPMEIRPVQPVNPMKPEVGPPRRQIWFRAARPIPEDPMIHQLLLAYSCDFSLLTTALHPHGVSWLTPGMHVASLDHAMWFHQPARLDDWLLHDMESPRAAGGRGLTRSRIFDRAGRLVATTAQEGLIRQRQR